MSDENKYDAPRLPAFEEYEAVADLPPPFEDSPAFSLSQMEEKIRRKLEEEQQVYREIEDKLRRQMKEAEIREKLRAEEEEAKRMEQRIRQRIQEEAEAKEKEAKEAEETKEKEKATRAAFVKQHNESKVAPFMAHWTKMTSDDLRAKTTGVDTKFFESILRTLLSELDTPALSFTGGVSIHNSNGHISLCLNWYIVTDTHVYHQNFSNVNGPSQSLKIVYTFHQPLSPDSLERKFVETICRHYWGSSTYQSNWSTSSTPTQPLGQGSLTLFREILKTIPGKSNQSPF